MDTPGPVPSLQVLADAAGVSKTTVSLALRNHASIGEATRLRVQQLARDMGYRTNPYVSALLSAVSRAKALPSLAPLAFVSDETPEDIRRQPRRRMYWDHAVRRGGEIGYRLDRFWLGTDGLSAKRLFDILRSRGVFGVIFGLVRNPQALAEVDLADFSCAAIDPQPGMPPVHSTESDSFANAFLLYEELFRRGYERVGLCMDIGSDRYRKYRARGALYAAYAERGVAVKVPPLEPEIWEPPVFAKWFNKHRPDVVVTVNPEVLGWLEDMKVKVPKQLGYANLAVPPSSNLETGLRNDPAALAAGAVDLVDAQLRRNERGLPAKAKRMAVMGNWFEGATLRPAPPRA